MKFLIPLFLSLLLLLAGCSQPGASAVPLQEIADNVNKKCPQMIDSETRLDGIAIKDNSTIVYKYTLVNVMKKNVDTAQFRSMMWPGLLSIIRTSPDLKTLRGQRINFDYDYRDKLDQLLYSFHITPKDYNP